MSYYFNDYVIVRMCNTSKFDVYLYYISTLINGMNELLLKYKKILNFAFPTLNFDGVPVTVTSFVVTV